MRGEVNFKGREFRKRNEQSLSGIILFIQVDGHLIENRFTEIFISMAENYFSVLSWKLYR